MKPWQAEDVYAWPSVLSIITGDDNDDGGQRWNKVKREDIGVALTSSLVKIGHGWVAFSRDRAGNLLDNHHSLYRDLARRMVIK